MDYDTWTYAQERLERAAEAYTVLMPAQVMVVLGIGKNSIYHLLNTGALRGFRVGRSWRISADALEEFMDCKK